MRFIIIYTLNRAPKAVIDLCGLILAAPLRQHPVGIAQYPRYAYKSVGEIGGRVHKAQTFCYARHVFSPRRSGAPSSHSATSESLRQLHSACRRTS